MRTSVPCCWRVMSIVIDLFRDTFTYVYSRFIFFKFLILCYDSFLFMDYFQPPDFAGSLILLYVSELCIIEKIQFLMRPRHSFS